LDFLHPHRSLKVNQILDTQNIIWILHNNPWIRCKYILIMDESWMNYYLSLMKMVVLNRKFVDQKVYPTYDWLKIIDYCFCRRWRNCFLRFSVTKLYINFEVRPKIHYIHNCHWKIYNRKKRTWHNTLYDILHFDNISVYNIEKIA
jgi:hypothetical protein